MSNSEFSDRFPRGGEEMMRLSGPAGRCNTEVVTVTTTVTTVSALPHRKSITLQNFGPATVWAGIGEDEAARDECLYLAPGAIFTLDLRSEIDVTLVTVSGTAKTLVLQTGP